MNNRLLQNYLDLSLNSEAKNSDHCSPKVSASEKKKLAKLTKAANEAAAAAANNNNNNNSNDIKQETHSNESTIGDFEFSGKNLLNGNNNINNEKQACSNTEKSHSEKIGSNESIEMNQLEQSGVSSSSSSSKDRHHQQKVIKQALHNSSNFNSISGVITGLEQNFLHMKAENCAKQEHTYNNPSLAQIESTYEINRIPSMKRPVYSVSTVATQADMDKGTISAERKDFKYRNQDMSDVESQILSIEVDLCSDAYASIADWYQVNNSSIKLNSSATGNQISIKPSTATGSIKDRYLSARKELASVTVNDYVAFKNCLNMQLQTARETTTTNKTLTPPKKENSLSLKPINMCQDSSADSNQTQPVRNRMIVRIASISSSKSNSTHILDNNNKDTTEHQSLPKQQSILAPFNQIEVTPSKEEIKLKQPFFSLNKDTDASQTTNLSSDNEIKLNDKKLSKLIYDAYQNALLANGCPTKAQDSTLLHSFPNNLYMYLDSTAPYLKSYLNIQENLINSKDCIENLIKLNIKKYETECRAQQVPPNPPQTIPPHIQQTLKQSSTLNTILDTNESQTSSRLEESFLKCYEANAKLKDEKERQEKQQQQIFRINKFKYPTDPNDIYSHVETSTDESESTTNNSNKLSRSNSNSTETSSSSTGETISSASGSSTESSQSPSNSTNTSSSTESSSTIGSLQGKSTTEPTTQNKNSQLDSYKYSSSMLSTSSENVAVVKESNMAKTGSYSLNQEEMGKLIQVNKADRLKKMLEEERAILEQARKKPPNTAADVYKCSSYTNKIYVDDEQQANEKTTTEENSKSSSSAMATPIINNAVKTKVNETTTNVRKNQFQYPDEDFSEDYNYPNNKEFIIEDDDLSSSATGSKNVRFSDDVSYI